MEFHELPAGAEKKTLLTLVWLILVISFAIVCVKTPLEPNPHLVYSCSVFIKNHPHEEIERLRFYFNILYTIGQIALIGIFSLYTQSIFIDTRYIYNSVKYMPFRVILSD